MIEIEKPKIETVELNEDAKYGKFVIEPYCYPNRWRIT